jgi:uncharacterized repeat protein (TIGR01451 family)
MSLASRTRAAMKAALVTAILAGLLTALTGVGEAGAAVVPSPAWSISSVAGPTNFAPGDKTGRDLFVVRVTNIGGAATSGPIIVSDTLPPGLTFDPNGGPFERPFAENDLGVKLSAPGACTAGPPISCRDETPLASGESLTMYVEVEVQDGLSGEVVNHVKVEGGGGQPVSGSQAVTISAIPAGFGMQQVGGLISEADGSADTQAGSHPYQLNVSFNLNSVLVDGGAGNGMPPSEDARDVTADLPPGLVVNPQATAAKCTEAQLEAQVPVCPDSSAVGLVRLTIGAFGAPTGQIYPLYNMVPPKGVPASFGFDAAGIGLYVHLLGGVRTGSDYGLQATGKDILQFGETLGVSTTLWGNPTDSSHDLTRGRCGLEASAMKLHESCPVGPSSAPLLTLPTACGPPLVTSIAADSWQHPGVFLDPPASYESTDVDGTPVGITECNKLTFKPSVHIESDPAVPTPSAPMGLDVDVKVPHDESYPALAEANLKEATVTLPSGVSLSPSAANGLEACSESQIGLTDPGPSTCPDASKVGTVKIVTPLLTVPLEGSVYVAQQGDAGPQQGTNPFNSPFALYLVAEGAGVRIKVPGRLSLDPITGQVSATFAEDPLTTASTGHVQFLPDLPFSDLSLHFFGGSRAALMAPPACGVYNVSSSLVPWSGGLPAVASSPIIVGGACSAAFAPSFSAGSTSNGAGTYAGFHMTLARDGAFEQFGALAVTLPPGLLAAVRNANECAEPQISTNTCDASSLIGEATVTAGPGSAPVPVNGGRVYLTGPYRGAPYGLSVVVPAVAGPFNLGEVRVRASISIDPTTAQVTVATDPLPTIVRGVPLDVRTINVDINRPEFVLNPTNCDVLKVSGVAVSTHGATAPLSNPFQVANCAKLPFKPNFAVSTGAQTSKLNGASLDVTVKNSKGSANIRAVKVDLPIQLPSRLETLQKSCVDKVFNANPAACLRTSVVGTATAVTPLLRHQLVGPAILVSHGGAAFPDLVIVLQGEGITLDLVGETFISKKGITSSTFRTIPDAPVSSFELKLPQGRHSALTAVLPLSANHSMCGQALRMPTAITGQNGMVVKQTTRIRVTGCSRSRTAVAKHHRRHPARRGRRRATGVRAR